MNFAHFAKPSRYIDSELNATGLLKRGLGDRTSQPDLVSIALAFPDVYEVGMSHLGVRLLYDIVNSLPFAFAERVFSPWSDLEEYMRRSGILLTSLESQIPLKEFDVVGFSLQYELSYTTLLNMLNLAGIPLRTAERQASRDFCPLIIAGGPCVVNPVPMSAFVDAFLIGDGEEAITELAERIRDLKLQGCLDRDSALRELSGIPGFYVPSIRPEGGAVRRRYVSDLDAAPYPVKPVVPYMSVVHDRLTIEISRGCTRGCRFCQAGLIYRPLRERSPERVLELVEQSLRNTGYEEVSFTSLSAGDYSCLLPLVREFNKRYRNRKIAVSLPSLRVAAVNREVLREIRSVRKTGFTIAPEAATARLRAVINKDFSAEEYERSLSTLFEEGWLNLKLYFMIGLPTERDEDVEAIQEMAAAAIRTAKRRTGRFVNVSVTVSPFVPKSHTPFQWQGQIPMPEMKRTMGYLRQVLMRSKIKYKGHLEEMSVLEAAFARGDERLSDLIEAAWERGCRLDGWSDFFDFSKWTEAMDRTGIDAASYAERSFDPHDALPWDVVDIGVGKEFLRREAARALTYLQTGDCRVSCAGCALDCAKGAEGAACQEPVAVARDEAARTAKGRHRDEEVVMRIRARFSKGGRLRFLSHLEVVSAITRALRRTGVPFVFSKGFHPAPRISFGPALSVGVSGEREYFDLDVNEPVDPEDLMRRVNGTLPEGLRIGAMTAVTRNVPSLSGFVRRYVYRVDAMKNGNTHPSGVWWCAEAGQATERGPLLVRRNGSAVDLSPCIAECATAVDGRGVRTVRLTLDDLDGLKVRIGEVVGAIWGEQAQELSVVRTALLGWKDGWVEPL
ncbi:MAG: TIGR03960 family B12-binding radical SAM protein [Chloroflexota bacterium]